MLSGYGSGREQGPDVLQRNGHVVELAGQVLLLQLIGEGQAGDGLRCLLLAARLGCATAHIYQDMSIARLTQGDLGGALADARRAVLLAGCGERLAARQGKRAEVRRCASPELLLNYASVLDKVDASHTAHPHILQLLRDFVDVACRVDESGTLACTARGAIAIVRKIDEVLHAIQ